MGFNNPDVPWRELERRLSGRPVRPDPAQPNTAQPNTAQPKPVLANPTQPDGGDAPGWTRKRGRYATPQVVSLIHRDRCPPYAELHAHSSFSYLDGASTPEELVEQAARLGLRALAVTDHDGMYGIPRFAAAATRQGMPTVFGAELSLDHEPPRTQSQRLVGARTAVPDPGGRHLLVLARDPEGYARLCRAISAAHRRGGSKGHPVHDLDELTGLAGGHWLILTGCRKGALRQALAGTGPDGRVGGTDRSGGPGGSGALDRGRRVLAELVDRFGADNVAVELTYARDPLADERFEALALLADEAGLPVVASTGAHFHRAERARLAGVLAAVRARSSLDELDGWLPAWAEAQLRSGEELARRFAWWPQAVPTAARLGAELAFDLKLISPKLPPFRDLQGFPDEISLLRHLALTGMVTRYGPDDERARARIEHELAIIEKEDFPGYFLIVWEIARFCRENGILCQGRGSAAGSAVCYALGVTAIDPVGHDLLFERFLSLDRKEPPDIDIDIESGEPREKVIQHVYETHGRDFAAQVANSITYRPKLAVRDVAGALGYPVGLRDAWSRQLDRGHWPAPPTPTGDPPAGDPPAGDPPTGDPPTGSPAGDTEAPIPALVLDLVDELLPMNTPRHLGIHSGGMVICDRPVVEVCPVEWARMPNRSVLQWDKDDCEYAHLVKFDLLGLGMLSALRRCFELIAGWHGDQYELATIPAEEGCVYDMLAEADTVGVFQVESRAQMQALPRLTPRRFYELAIQVALIRPGPIQGDAVHPYIRRNNGTDPITYPHPSMKKALERTKGVPLFQEQLMEIAIDSAGFSPTEADQLRRALGSKRGIERIDALEGRLYEGLAGNGIVGAVADDVVNRIKAFASFGFAESHSLSFALLVYVSAWLKRHYPAAFLAALLNSQPMGFYSPQSLVHDARRHAVEVRSPHVNRSAAGAGLEDPERENLQCCRAIRQPAVRLGLQSVRGVETATAERIVAARATQGPFTSLSDFARRTGVSAAQTEALATAGAFDDLGLSRRDAIWAAGAAAAHRPGQLAVNTYDETAIPELPQMSGPEQLIADLWATGVSLDAYPTELIRPRLDALGAITAVGLRRVPDRTRVWVGGIVTHRQRPATASGVTFLSLEDETGLINIICRPDIWARHHRAARDAGALLIRGMLERTGEVTNVMAERIDRLPLAVRNTSRDFR